MTDVAHVIQQLDILIRRGRALRTAPSAEVRLWQRDVGALVNELSGGSKAHWLARAFSDAFLVRGDAGRVVEGVDAAEIVERLIAVLERGRLAIVEAGGLIAAPPESPARIRRFDFIDDPDLKPVVETAYADSRRALDEGRYAAALMLSCSVLEAIVTHALEKQSRPALAALDVPASPIAEWPFDVRVRVAKRAGVIGAGCARLPASAWTYHDLADANGAPRAGAIVSEHDARVAGQVLHVIMRDLDPGR